MAADDTSGARPGPVVLRIKLRYDDVEAMVQRFAPNVGKSGLFLPTKSVQPVGAEVKFELRLADDTPVLVGLGKVKVVKSPDPDQPKAAFGMAIELLRVTRDSRALILRMLERRKALGLPETALPLPGDIDAARRAEVMETRIRDTVSVAAPAAPQVPIESEPVSSLLTAPRRQSGPVAVAKVVVIAPLAPEPPRRKRMALSELIESASGPITAVTIPGLDEDVDVGAILARARNLAGGNLDAELDALRERAAAPVEISVEAASAELAKQLGGSSVDRQRDRATHWAPPPSTVSVPASADQLITEPSVPAIEPPVPEPEVTAVSESVDVTHELEPDDLEEELEQTQFSEAAIGPTAFDHHAFVTEPAVGQDELAQRLDDHLAAAEAEAEADDLGLASPIATSFDEMAMDAAIDEAMQSQLVARLSSEDLLGVEPDAQEPDAQEVDDFEILAESDVDDPELITSHGEQAASHGFADEPERQPLVDAPTAQPGRESRASLSDFASRLDLDDDSFDVSHSALDPRALGSSALAAFDEPDDDPDSSFTHAGVLPQDSLEFAALPQEPRSAGAFDRSDVDDAEEVTRHAPADDGYDLESALDALDVDLDDLSVPLAPTELARATPRASSNPRGRALPRAPRATTEDGLEVEFDDDDDR